MKLGDVLKKEREKKDLSVEEVAEGLGIPGDEYQELEAGESPAEAWGPRLAYVAVALGVPTSRLLADSGRFDDAREGRAGSLIRAHRERLEKTVDEVVAVIDAVIEEDQVDPAMRLTADEYREIEAGKSPIEKYGPLLLGFAEAIDQPVFNLFYPCCLPFQELDDYP